MSDRRDALEALIGSQGWRDFLAYAGEQWGPKAYANKLKAAVSHARSVGKDASQAIELVDAANDAVADLMRWPADEIGRLKRSEHVPELTMSRRGGL